MTQYLVLASLEVKIYHPLYISDLSIYYFLMYITIGASAITTGFTNGAGPIWLDNVQCRGTETRLIDCPASPLGTHNCAHIEDAGVRCGGKLKNHSNHYYKISINLFKEKIRIITNPYTLLVLLFTVPSYSIENLKDS